MSDDSESILAAIIRSVIIGEKVASNEWPNELGDLKFWGLADGSDGIEAPIGIDWLKDEKIREALTPPAAAWLKDLDVEACVNSTNDRLLGKVDLESCGGYVCIAEVQTKGRGRRGRKWHTPLGGNLAISLGLEIKRDLAELSGLSLVIGLSVLDAIESFGVEGLSVKWPNDLMMEGKKLGGILIELANTTGSEHVSTALIGIGVNLSLNERVTNVIEQQVTDLSQNELLVDRNKLVGKILSSLVEYIDVFEAKGFKPFREQYNLHHILNNRHCQIELGSRKVSGRVIGIDSHGEIELDTNSGPLIFAAGEVSLRPLPID